MTDRKYWIWLSSHTNVSHNSKAAVIEFFDNPENAFFSPRGSFREIEGVTSHDAEILEERDISRAEEIISQCEKLGQQIITIEDSEYPSLLKEFYAPPYVLYVMGTLPDFNREIGIAVIGTRNASPYGIKMGRQMGYELAACGGIIITGLTGGIECGSADAALKAGGKVVAVLGTSIEKAPDRAVNIASSGAVISEYAPGTPFRRQFYRHRNRISAGLSRAVCVIEAPEKSGTRLFVAEALEQGKEIFAVPGNADSENSSGTLKFLREGAHPVAHGWEIAEELNSMYHGTLDGSVRDTLNDIYLEEETPEIIPEQKKIIDKENSACYIDKTQLTETQYKIVESLLNGCCAVDEIIISTGIPASTVLAELTMLQISGKVRKEAGGNFKICGK